MLAQGTNKGGKANLLRSPKRLLVPAKMPEGKYINFIWDFNMGIYNRKKKKKNIKTN